jgi:hypothetical protein
MGQSEGSNTMTEMMILLAAIGFTIFIMPKVDQ